MTSKVMDISGGGMPPVTPLTPVITDNTQTTPPPPLPPRQGLDTGTIGGLIGAGAAGVAKAAPYVQPLAARALVGAGALGLPTAGVGAAALGIPLAAGAAVPAVGGVVGHTLAGPIADMIMPQSPLRQQLSQDASAIGDASGFGKIQAAVGLYDNARLNMLKSAWGGFGEGIQGLREAMAQKGVVGGMLSGQPSAQAAPAQAAPAQAAPGQAAKQIVPGSPEHGQAAFAMQPDQFKQSLKGMTNHEGMQLLQAMAQIPSHGDQALAEVHNLYNKQYAAELNDATSPAEQLKAYQNHVDRLLTVSVRGIGAMNPDLRR